MNIFVLDTSPGQCARYHCDKHIVKMATEYAQILATAARALGYEHDSYRDTHLRHPSTMWAYKDEANWAWLYRLAMEVGAEYTMRYGRIHKATTELLKLPVDLCLYAQKTDDKPTPWAQVVPEDCLHKDPVEAYRQTYRRHKAKFCTWKAPASEPQWFYHDPA